jgi:hypothetical protein
MAGKWSQRTLAQLHAKMLATDHAMDRLLDCQDEGLTVGEVEELIELQNEAYLAYHRGDDIQSVRRIAFQAGALAEEYGLNVNGWGFYH